METHNRYYQKALNASLLCMQPLEEKKFQYSGRLEGIAYSESHYYPNLLELGQMNHYDQMGHFPSGQAQGSISIWTGVHQCLDAGNIDDVIDN